MAKKESLIEKETQIKFESRKAEAVPHVKVNEY